MSYRVSVSARYNRQKILGWACQYACVGGLILRRFLPVLNFFLLDYGYYYLWFLIWIISIVYLLLKERSKVAISYVNFGIYVFSYVNFGIYVFSYVNFDIYVFLYVNFGFRYLELTFRSIVVSKLFFFCDFISSRLVFS